MSGRILLVDGQILQTNARDRGMGRFSSRLILSIIDENEYDHVEVLLTKRTCANPVSKESIKSMFGNVHVTYLDLATTLHAPIEKAKEHNAGIINEYIDKHFSEKHTIDFLIPSPFQEPAVSVYPEAVKKIVVFYDLIPFLNHTRYQPVMPFENYLKRFNLLFDADAILTISKAVKDDVMTYLGIPDDRLKVIDGGPITLGTHPVKPKIDIPEYFVLMPTSDDPRKNNLMAVIAFESFRKSHAKPSYLVITSKIHKSERIRLEVVSSNLIFTGNVSDDELDWLYEQAAAILFVPESEGLGLPILEGVAASKPIVCSSIPVFREISKEGLYYTDYRDPMMIADCLENAVTEAKVDDKEYKRILDHYSWSATGKRAVSSMREASISNTHERPRIAIFTPRTDGLSAVGKVVSEGHATLSKYFDVDYYTEQGVSNVSTRPDFLKHIAKCFPAACFSVEKYQQYEAVIYHIGNSDYHIFSIANALYLPGIVILHDTKIGEAFRIMEEQDMISHERAVLEKVITDKQQVDTSSHLYSIVQRQVGFLTHSKYASEAVASIAEGSYKSTISEAALPTHVGRMDEHRRYDAITIGLAGIIAGIKGLDVIKTIASDNSFRNTQIHMFGYNFASEETLDEITSFDNVELTTNLTDFDFQNSLRDLDIFVNYRMKYQGETSLSTLEAMRHGCVVIVRNIGWYSQLPDDCVVKVDKELEVVEVLKQLILDKGRLTSISKNAKEYVQKSHSHEKYVQSLLGLINDSSVSKCEPNIVSSTVKTGSITTAEDMKKLVLKNEASE
ncbi:glycosyltransferase [Candidatus Saccharibacteria bacterium]|nr:MAG: glycosyltransferase [Candidatus Saccharibacteria bacterium]